MMPYGSGMGALGGPQWNGPGQTTGGAWVSLPTQGATSPRVADPSRGGSAPAATQARPVVSGRFPAYGSPYPQ
jgi:hypothetical protein